MRLRDACRAGVADGVIFSLFEVTLKGIRAQPFVRGVSKTVAGLDSFLSGRSNVQELKQKRPAVIRLARSPPRKTWKQSFVS